MLPAILANVNRDSADYRDCRDRGILPIAPSFSYARGGTPRAIEYNEQQRSLSLSFQRTSYD